MCIHYRNFTQINFFVTEFKDMTKPPGYLSHSISEHSSIKINGCFVSNGNIYLKKEADVEAKILVEMMNNRGHDYNNCRMRDLTRFCEGNVPSFKQKGHMLTLIILSRPAEVDIPKISLGTIFQTKASLTQYRLSCIILSCSVRLEFLSVG